MIMRPRHDSRDPNHAAGVNLIIFCILAFILAIIAPYAWTNRPIKFVCAGLQLAQVHVLLTAHLLNRGLDPGENGREYMIIYSMFMVAQILWNLPRFMSLYFPGPNMSLDDMRDSGF